MLLRRIACLLPLLVACGDPAVPPGGSDAELFAEVVAVETAIPPSGEGYDLYDVRSVRGLEDGRIAALNTGTFEVLVFSDTGELLARLGGEGEGPGEFSRPWFMTTLPGDSILVTDRRLPQRTVVFAADGTVGRSFNLAIPEAGSLYASPKGIVSDGVLVGTRPIDPLPPGATVGAIHVPWSVAAFDLTGALLHQFHDEGVGSTFHLMEVESRLRAISPPFRRGGFVIAGPMGIVMADSHSSDVLLVASDGTVRDTIRLGWEPPALTTSLVDSVRRAWADQPTTEEGRVVRRRALSDIGRPERRAHIADVFVDRQGRIWVATADVGGERTETWLVHSGDSLLGRIEIPTDIELADGAADRILGIRADSLGVQSVVRLDLEIR